MDSHMLLDEETEFQLSRLESQQDDLEDWSRSLQHQVRTVRILFFGFANGECTDRCVGAVPQVQAAGA